MNKQHSPDQQLPIQPVEKPILCSPYEEPTEHWVYDSATGSAERVSGRRRAFYLYKSQRVMTQQISLGFVAEEESEALPLVNALREDVQRWRKRNKWGVSCAILDIKKGEPSRNGRT